MTRSRGTRLCIVLLISVLALAGCSSAASPGGDYPAYDEHSLVDSATLIVEGTAIETEATILTPRHSGDNAEENPLHGLSDEDQHRALQDDGVEGTAVTLKLTRVHRGSAKPGDKVVILQTGRDGHETDMEPILEPSKDYLLFATESVDGMFVILGGSAGMFSAVSDGSFAAVNTSAAPFDEISRSRLQTLLG